MPSKIQPEHIAERPDSVALLARVERAMREALSGFPELYGSRVSVQIQPPVRLDGVRLTMDVICGAPAPDADCEKVTIRAKRSARPGELGALGAAATALAVGDVRGSEDDDATP